MSSSPSTSLTLAGAIASLATASRLSATSSLTLNPMIDSWPDRFCSAS